MSERRPKRPVVMDASLPPGVVRHGIWRLLESVAAEFHVVRCGGEDVQTHQQRAPMRLPRGKPIPTTARCEIINARDGLRGVRNGEASNPAPQLLHTCRGGVGRNVVPRITEQASLRHTQVDSDDELLATTAAADTRVDSV